MQIFANSALLSSDWAKNVRISIEEGVINAIHLQTALHPNDLQVDTILPALPNLHSHSFQRAMAGMCEYRTKDHDSFWTWRDLMYRFWISCGQMMSRQLQQRPLWKCKRRATHQ